MGRLEQMSGRTTAWAGAVLLLLAGVLVGALVHGITGEAIALSLISLGLIAAVSMVFYEVGLSEDRAREAEEQERRSRFRGRRPPSRRRR